MIIKHFVQSKTCSYKSDKPNSITGNDKVHLKSDCFFGSIVNGIGEPILYSFGLDQPPGHKVYKEPRIKPFKKLKKSVSFNITFYLDDDDHKRLVFINKTTSFTCQLKKI